MVHLIHYTHMKHTANNLPKSSLLASPSSELSSVSVVGVVSVVLRRVAGLGGSESICLRRLDLRGVAVVSASAGCGMAFTTADTMSGMSAAVRGRVFNLFSREAPGLSGFPLFFPAVAGVLVAGDLVFAGGLLGGDFSAVRLFPSISSRTIATSFPLASEAS